MAPTAAAPVAAGLVAAESIAGKGIAFGGLPVGPAARLLVPNQPDTTSQPVTAQQLPGGLPVVVPAALALESVDLGRLGPPATELMHRFDDRPAVAGRHVADDAVDVEQQDSSGAQGEEGRLDW